MPAPEASAKALNYVEKALAIDDGLPEAYATLGWIRLNECNGPAAATAFEKAIQLNDRYLPAYQWYASYCNVVGNSERAAVLLRKALEIDSVSDYTKTISAWQLVRPAPEEAANILDSVLQSRPDFALAHYVRGYCAMAMNQADAAVRSLETAVQIPGGQPFYLSGLAQAYAKAGRREDALRTIQRLESGVELGSMETVSLAEAFLELGDKERCCQILERYLVQHGGIP